MNIREQHLKYLKEKGKFQIDCSTEIFNNDEIQILKDFGYWFKALSDGTLEPFTDLQKQFIAVINSEKEPFTLEEKAWYKYLGRKKVEEKYGDRLKVRYIDEDNTFYTNDDIKKVQSGTMKTLWDTHIDAAQIKKFKIRK